MPGEIETSSLRKPEAWEEDVPLYFVECEDVTVRVGTNYPGGADHHTIIARIVFQRGKAIEDLPFERIMGAMKRALLSQVKELCAFRAVSMLGGVDSPEDLDWIRPGRNVVYIFWFMPEEGLTVPWLGVRFRYHYIWVLTVKNALSSERERLEIPVTPGLYMKEWRHTWAIRDWRAIPNVLGALIREGMKIEFVRRDGFPGAPPVVGVDEHWWAEWEEFSALEQMHEEKE